MDFIRFSACMNSLCELVLLWQSHPFVFYGFWMAVKWKVSLIIPPCPTKQILKFISCLSCVLFQSYNKYLELVWSRVIATDAENSKKLINGSIWNVGVALIWWYQVQCTIIICIQYTHTHADSLYPLFWQGYPSPIGACCICIRQQIQMVPERLGQSTKIIWQTLQRWIQKAVNQLAPSSGVSAAR